MANKVFQSMNHAAIYTLRQQDSRFLRNDEESETELFISLSLATPAKQADEKYSERLNSTKIVTLNHGNVELSELSDDSLVAFSVTMASRGKSSFSHKALSDANSESFVAETQFTLYTDGDSVSGIVPHIGYDMPEKQALALVKNHVAKLGATRQWKKVKGQYTTL